MRPRPGDDQLWIRARVESVLHRHGIIGDLGDQDDYKYSYDACVDALVGIVLQETVDLRTDLATEQEQRAALQDKYLVLQGYVSKLVLENPIQLQAEKVELNVFVQGQQPLPEPSSGDV